MKPTGPQHAYIFAKSFAELFCMFVVCDLALFSKFEDLKLLRCLIWLRLFCKRVKYISESMNNFSLCKSSNFSFNYNITNIFADLKQDLSKPIIYHFLLIPFILA